MNNKVTVSHFWPWRKCILFCDDPNAMWRIWRELFLEVLNKHAPFQHNKTNSSNVPWITNKVKCLITTRNKLKRKLSPKQTDRSNVTFHRKTYVNDFAKRYEISLGIRSLPLKRFSISFTEFSVR